MKKMSREEKMNELGLMGEKIVTNYLNSLGCSVQHSIDKYDREKDMLVDGKSIEVKTQVPFIWKKSLTIRENQIKKCRNVDDLYFVTVPAPAHSYEWSGWLLRVDPKEFKTITYTTKRGDKMILIPIDQVAVSPVKKIEESYIKELQKYTVSEY